MHVHARLESTVKHAAIDLTIDTVILSRNCTCTPNAR